MHDALGSLVDLELKRRRVHLYDYAQVTSEGAYAKAPIILGGLAETLLEVSKDWFLCAEKTANASRCRLLRLVICNAAEFTEES
jgi:hypothetical protein